MKIACPHCNTRYMIQPANAGKRTKCAKCQGVFQAPLPQARIVEEEPLPLAIAVDDYGDPLEDELGLNRSIRKKKHKNAEAGFICSIISVVLGGLSLLIFGILFGIAGFVLGILGVRWSENKVLGIIGIALSSISMILALTLGLFLVGALLAG